MDTWDGSYVEDEMFDEDISPETNTFIQVNNSKIDIQPGSDFKAVILETARNAGLGKFTVMLNGTEVTPNGAPSVFEEGTRVELLPFDIAG